MQIIFCVPVRVSRFLRLCLVPMLLFVSLGVHASAEVDARQTTVDHGTVLITGSNRGIGLEFARQYAAAGWEVIATCRDPAAAAELKALAADNPRVHVERLDVTEAPSIAALAEKYAGQPLQLLINNAALLGSRNDQSFAKQDFELALSQYDVNALGPMRVSQAFLDSVRAGGPGKIIVLGSAAGSNGYLRPPADFFSYRASKAATHLLAHNLAIDLASEKIVVGLINPGLVDTRGLAKLGPDDPVPPDFEQIVKLIRAGAIELTPPEASVAAMIELIDSLGTEDSGKFMNFDGQPMPW